MAFAKRKQPSHFTFSKRLSNLSVLTVWKDFIDIFFALSAQEI